MSPSQAQIQSLQNPAVKEVVRLRKKRHRENTGRFVIDGLRDFFRAVELGIEIREVYVDPSCEAARTAAAQCGVEPVSCSSSVLQKMSYRENPEGLLAVAAAKRISLEDIDLSGSPLLLVADRLEKPGNIGALLRSADAAGADAVILSDGVPDLYNPNVIRSSTGTLFSQPVVSARADDVRAWLKKNRIKLVTSRPDAEQNYMFADLTPPVALILGAEDSGLSEDWVRAADLDVFIPMNGLADSLNVSAAGTLLLYEALKQKGLTAEQQRPPCV